ncbi:MAG TPA: aldo/keto reductase [Pseudothermotoga sp.]|nr:aldo/keto reductase [Pseudothermotoga sp.]HOK82993.1 aldo/keto reductase [Pseudothermotoga sp.]HPP69838.1 aldo/keto reductase [Pseudothermotoga sp.]
MRYRSTKRFPLNASVVGLGCWGLSGPSIWKDSNDSDSIKIVHKALESGINFFDVAPVYGFGHAEEILGKALRGFARDKVIIATKCGLIWDEQKRITRCLKPESVFKEIDESLRRLGTDYVDLYQLHWPDPNTPIEETIDALLELKKAGKVRFIGLSNFSVDTARRLLEHISSMQGLYNMFERNALSYHNIPLEYRTEREVLPFCEENDLAFLPYSPLMQGVLTGDIDYNEKFTDVRAANPKLVGDNLRKYIAIVEKLKAIGSKIGKPVNEIAMNWLIKHRPITSIIAGATKPEQLEENLKALDWEMDNELFNEIEAIVLESGILT